MSVLRRAALEADAKEKDKILATGSTALAIHGPLAPSPIEAIGTRSSLVKKCLGSVASRPAREERIASAFVNRSVQVIPASGPEEFGSLVIGVVGTRQHASTDKILEYRVEIAPSQLVL